MRALGLVATHLLGQDLTRIVTKSLSKKSTSIALSTVAVVCRTHREVQLNIDAPKLSRNLQGYAVIKTHAKLHKNFE